MEAVVTGTSPVANGRDGDSARRGYISLSLAKALLVPPFLDRLHIQSLCSDYSAYTNVRQPKAYQQHMRNLWLISLVNGSDSDGHRMATNCKAA